MFYLISPVRCSSSSFSTLFSSPSAFSSPSFAFLVLSFTGTTVKLVGIFTPCVSSQRLLFVTLLSLSFFPSLSRCSAASLFLPTSSDCHSSFLLLFSGICFYWSDLLPLCTSHSWAATESYFRVLVPIARILLSTHVTPTPTAPLIQIRKRAAPPNRGSTQQHTHSRETKHS